MTHSNNKEVAERENLSKYKFYNLLFTGKINMKEYLSALQSMENSRKK